MKFSQPDAIFKVCVFGDGGVGKTTLINRFITDTFINGYDMTIGVEFKSKILKIEGYKIYLQIWDLAGEERFRFLMSNYITGASGGILMYDITRYNSLLHLKDWYEVIKEGYEGEILFPMILVGGKADLDQLRVVYKDDALNYLKTYNLVKFVEVSSKTGEGVRDLFIDLSNILLKNVIFKYL